MLAAWSADTRLSRSSFSDVRCSFIDPETNKVLKVEQLEIEGIGARVVISPSHGSFELGVTFVSGSNDEKRIHSRASASGDVFALWRTDASPTGVRILSLRGRTAHLAYRHDSFGYLAPSPDGLTYHTGRVGLFDTDSDVPSDPSSRPPPSPELNLPATDPAYYLGVRGLSDGGAPSSGAEVTLYAADGTRLLTIGALEEMEAVRRDEDTIAHDFTVDKRFHFVPAAKLLITVPPTDDRLVLRKLDPASSLDQPDGPECFVTSARLLRARVGGSLIHRIEVRSKARDIRFRLEEGPEGLAVSRDGRLTWKPPESAAGSTVRVRVVVAAPSGSEQIHRLTIRVD
jgi:hypothetical protein